jgi:hypothetical protein
MYITSSRISGSWYPVWERWPWHASGWSCYCTEPPCHHATDLMPVRFIISWKKKWRKGTTFKTVFKRHNFSFFSLAKSDCRKEENASSLRGWEWDAELKSEGALTLSTTQVHISMAFKKKSTRNRIWGSEFIAQYTDYIRTYLGQVVVLKSCTNWIIALIH